MIKQEMLKSAGLNLHDATVRYALRNVRSRKNVPVRSLGKNENGERRTQKEARVIFSQVRQVLRSLQEQEIKDKAFMKKLKLEAAKKRDSQIKQLKEEADKLEKAVNKNERLKMIERSAIKQKLEKLIPLRPVRVRAPKKIDTSKPFILGKADGRTFTVQPEQARSLAFA